MRSYDIEAASDAFEQNLTDVLTRSEPVQISSSWGEVVLLPEAYLLAWKTPAREISALSDRAMHTVDAAMHTWRWDTVSTLRDTDTGVWKVATASRAWIVDLDLRLFSDADTRAGLNRASPGSRKLASVGLCREGEPLVWTTRAAQDDRAVEAMTGVEPVTSITRLDSGPPDSDDTHSQPGAGDTWREGTDAAKLKTSDSRRLVASQRARKHLADLVADVASRLDRVVVVSSAGRALLVSVHEFDSVAYFAKAALEMIEPTKIVDARNACDVGQHIVELRDTDSGDWLVTTSVGQLILAMAAKIVIRIPRDGDLMSLDMTRLPITHLVHCRVDQPLLWETEASADGSVENVRGNAVVVWKITRLEDWLYS